MYLERQIKTEFINLAYTALSAYSQQDTVTMCNYIIIPVQTEWSSMLD